MSEGRVVDIRIPGSDLIKIATEIESWQELWEVIGYLSTWAQERFPQVEIYRDGDLDLLAVYRHQDGSHGYTIGAVWHQDGEKSGHYGYHS